MEKNNKEQETMKCCQGSEERKSRGLIQGIIYGAIPHSGCIAFVLFSIFGMTFAASLFKPLLAKAYFFQAMILLSFIFATISAFFYLRKNGGVKSIKKHKNYLLILYGTTIVIALMMYFLIFPMISSVTASSITQLENQDSIISLKVAIPCEGHAPLITDELKKIKGVGNIQFASPNTFTIYYSSKLTNPEQILSLDIFKEYKATIR